MSNAKEKMNKAYIDSKLAGIIEPMVGALCADAPPDEVSQISLLILFVLIFLLFDSCFPYLD